tara:strand:- start:14162 stop:14476 length:315 start_codon:yes stop_codon:yes gene_type:complete
MAEQAEKKFQRPEGRGVGGSNSIHRTMYPERYMRNETQSKPKFVNSIPEQESGQNGDIVYFVNERNFNKVEQYLKHENQWINITSGRPSTDNAKVKKFIQAKAG